MRNVCSGLSFVLADGAAVLFRLRWEEVAASTALVSS